MLLIEFDVNVKDTTILKYRHIDEKDWYYLHINIETLSTLISHFGIISTYKIPTQYTNVDNPTTSQCIKLKYCGANIEMNCNSSLSKQLNFNLSILEQNF